MEEVKIRNNILFFLGSGLDIFNLHIDPPYTG